MLKNRVFITNSAKETEEIAKTLALSLFGGEVIALSGELGSGKTTFSKGLAKGLGVTDIITSPTFVLVKEHNIKDQKVKIKKLIHIDCYRLKSYKDAISLGLTDYFDNQDFLTIIEWPEKIKKILPKNAVLIKFQYIDMSKRKISVVSRKRKNDISN